ncbi:putative GNAT family acetyltransferase [Aspergillus karnatakaensis]|uniref:GNAT family N-acetyltransferase n=1 Tax=Aspergillus karnatakaensis TaxID=1810916 RepID=UPI003CCDF642
MADSTQRPLPPNYTLETGYPPLNDYLHLRAATGLSPKTPAQGAAVPSGSWYGLFISYTDPETNTSTPVAMGRIIGDGGWYFHIADMAVLPDHQRKGLGDIVLKRLLEVIYERAPEGRPYITLLADAPGVKLYRKNGFVDTAPGSVGMMYLPKKEGE